MTTQTLDVKVWHDLKEPREVFINLGRNLMTPNLVKYGKNSQAGLYYEISSGEGFRGNTIYGVTFIDYKGRSLHFVSRCLETKEKAQDWANYVIDFYKSGLGNREKSIIGYYNVCTPNYEVPKEYQTMRYTNLEGKSCEITLKDDNKLYVTM